MTHFKNGVVVHFNPTLNHIIEVVEGVFGAYHYNWVVTAGSDGKHGAHSYHYQHLALDIRTRHLKPQDLPAIHHELQIHLPTEEGWDVVLEPDHFHIERDVKRVPLRPDEQA